MAKEYPRTLEHAHLRIDYLERDFKVMTQHLEKIAEEQESTNRHNSAIKWLLLGGISFYIIETIGVIEFIKMTL